MAGADCVDRALLPQGEQERRPASLSAGDDAADPPAAAVVFTQRSGDGRGPDRGAHHAPFCRHGADQRPDSG